MGRHQTDYPTANGMPQQPEQAATVGPEPAAVAAELRRAGIQRMIAMNRRCAEVAWERRRRDPISPHALAMLFVQHETRPNMPYPYRLTAAAKLWLAGTDERDLTTLLFRFGHHLAGQRFPAGFDIRELATSRDDDMGNTAIYAGLGISTLDTYAATWEQVQATTERPENIPGCVRIILTDGTIATVERRGMNEFNALNVACTQALEYAPGVDPYAWTRATAEQMMADPQHARPLQFMIPLHDLLWQLDRDRHVAARTKAAATSDRRLQ